MKKIFILIVLSCCSFMSAIAQSDNKIDLIKRDEGALNTRTANGMDYYTGKDYVKASNIIYLITGDDETYRHVMYLIDQDSENTVKLSRQTFKGVLDEDRPRLHTDIFKLEDIIESNIPKTQLADLKKNCHDFIGINIYVDPETGKVIYVNYALALSRNNNGASVLSLPPQIYENIGNEIKNTFNYKDQITDEYKKYPVLRYAYTYIFSQD